MMRTKIVYILSIFCFTGITFMRSVIQAQQTKRFTISADIKGLPDNVELALVTSDGSKLDTLKVASSKAGRFNFNLDHFTVGKIHFVMADTTVFKPKNRKAVMLILENRNVKLTGTASQWPEVTITGAPATIVLMNYEKKDDSYINQINVLMADYRKTLPVEQANTMSIDTVIQNLLKGTDTLASKFKTLHGEWKSFLNNYLVTYKNSLALPLIIKKSYVVNIDGKQKAYDDLLPDIKTSFYGKELLMYINDERHAVVVAKKQGELAIGKRMPDFKISSPEGKALNVLDIALKSDYTLIDFWASWCVPCRDAIPKIKEVYDSYREKGFNVLAISTDKVEADWKKAMMEENTKWINGRDNIDGAAKNIFGLAAIPAYILLDKNGIIVQTDYFTGAGGIKINREDEKSLARDLKEIVAELFKGK